MASNRRPALSECSNVPVAIFPKTTLICGFRCTRDRSTSHVACGCCQYSKFGVRRTAIFATEPFDSTSCLWIISITQSRICHTTLRLGIPYGKPLACNLMSFITTRYIPQNPFDLEIIVIEVLLWLNMNN